MTHVRIKKTRDQARKVLELAEKGDFGNFIHEYQVLLKEQGDIKRELKEVLPENFPIVKLTEHLAARIPSRVMQNHEGEFLEPKEASQAATIEEGVFHQLRLAINMLDKMDHQCRQLKKFFASIE